MPLHKKEKELIHISFLTELSESEQIKLNELLRNSEEARDYYRHSASLDTHFKDFPHESFNLTPKKRNSISIWKVAAIFFMLLSFVLTTLIIPPDFIGDHPEQFKHKSVAVLQHAVSLNNEDATSLNEGQTLFSGPIHLKQGLIQLDFISGVTLIGEGPLKLDLINDMEVKCLQGKVRVLVPPQAIGFKLHTPDTEVLDLGTEFGIDVSEQGSNITVLDGKVELYENKKMKAELLQGQNIHVQNGQYKNHKNKFLGPSPLDLSFALEQRTLSSNKIWIDSIHNIKQDKDLKIYYDFRKKDPWGKTLHNLMAPKDSLTYGAIIGAQWADGRLGKDSSLEFIGNNNFIRFEDNFSYNSLTLLTWVRIDNLKSSFTSLLSSDYWKEKGVHWHISKLGVMTLGVYAPKGKNAIFRSPEDTFHDDYLGKWIMITATYDGATGIGRQYINNKLVDEHKNLDESIAIIGKAQIGNWFNGYQTLRSLNGKMDRFAVWSKALNQEEITKNYILGNPSLKHLSVR